MPDRWRWALVLLAIGIFYEVRRHEPRLAAMLLAGPSW